MQKSLLFTASLGLSLIVCASASAIGLPTAGTGNSKLAKLAEARQTKTHAVPNFFRTGNTNKALRHAAPVVGNAPVATLTSTGGWGQLEGEDGQTWFYTTRYDVSGFYYTGAEITIYNPQHEVAGTISVATPEGKNVNDITPFGTITTKMFDKNSATTELAVSMHITGDASNNYTGSYKTLVYHLEDGSKASEFDGSGVIISIVKNSWTKYQRLLLINDVTVTTGEGDDATSADVEQITVMRPPSWGDDEMVADHTFSYNLDNAYYMEGSPFNVFEIDGEAVYVTALYTTPLVTGYDENYDFITDPDAKFAVVTYDQKYNRLDSLAVPMEKPDDAYIRMAAFGMMSSKDLSRNYFFEDGNLDYVITFEDYLTASDEYRYDFDLYDHEGTKQKDICDNVYSTYFSLAPINGQSDQMAFLQTKDDVQQIQMVNLPSCENATLMPAQIEADYISTNLNRVPKGDSYQYVVKMLYASSDDSDNVIARIGWYNPDLTLDHFTSINLGPNAENFSPNLTDEALNPYLFNTTDDMEFFYIAKVKRTDSEALDNVLAIADDAGTTLKTFSTDATKGAIYSGMLFTANALKPELGIIYYNDTTDVYSMDFYALPFSKFEAGGDGSATNPYLISTAGDLQQVANEPAAHYRLAQDIDMTQMSGSFSPIGSFSGTLDGAGKVIANLVVDCDDTEAGLFADMTEGAKVSDLTFTKPSITVNSQTSYAGVLAGSCVGDTITGVHVIGANILSASSTDYASAVGGLVGSASYYTKVASSSFEGDINVPATSNVGGIAGETRTSTDIVACFTKGDFIASGTLGGIVGQTGNTSSVKDCHSLAALTAKEVVGGIVGESLNRGPIANCYFTGSVTATESSWYGYSAGGIVGSLSADWNGASTKVLSGCVTTANINVPELDGTVHRIAGYTSEYDQEGASVENGLANNYALATLTVGGNTISSDDATTAEGKDIAQDGLTTDFFTSLGYGFGQTEAKPWKATDSLPVLYYETKNGSTSIDTVAAKAEGLRIGLAAGQLKAEGAVRMAIFTLSGTQVAAVAGSTADASRLSEGTYVVTATDAEGHTSAVKVVIR